VIVAREQRNHLLFGLLTAALAAGVTYLAENTTGTSTTVRVGDLIASALFGAASYFIAWYQTTKPNPTPPPAAPQPPNLPPIPDAGRHEGADNEAKD
jgi:hypothetical protein